jgi:hypothetical protein
MIETGIIKTPSNRSQELTWEGELKKFNNPDWPVVLEELGGYSQVYEEVKTCWAEKGIATEWGVGDADTDT